MRDQVKIEISKKLNIEQCQGINVFDQLCTRSSLKSVSGLSLM